MSMSRKRRVTGYGVKVPPGSVLYLRRRMSPVALSPGAVTIIMRPGEYLGMAHENHPSRRDGRRSCTSSLQRVSWTVELGTQGTVVPGSQSHTGH